MATRLKLGLPNYGNTCYINSVLQCLRYSKPLVYMLRDHRVTNNKNDKKDQLLESFVELLYADADPRDLHIFIRNLAHLQQQFRLLRQCDAHELYLYIVDTFFEKFENLKNPFKGMLKSTVTCNACGNNSVSKHPFISLSLEMDQNAQEQCVSQMLKRYQTYEELQDKIDCDNCKVRQFSQKILHVVDNPTLLVIHLKRFNGMQKNNASIKIEKKIEVNNDQYKLIALCNHSGTMNGGHYTASCRRRDELWIVCNDNNISNIQDLPNSTSVPYILFYQAI